MSIAELRLRHDSSFKRFVQNAEFLRHLLRARPLPNLDEADVVGVRPSRANLIRPDLTQPVVDAAWELALRDGRLVYVLVECQSTLDPAMPIRMLETVSTLYHDLSREPPGDGRYGFAWVPCIKHLTVYSGRPKWTGAEEFSKLVEAGKGREVPRMKCQALDLRRLKGPEGEENLAVLLARLQRCEDPEGLRKAAEPLRRWVGDAEHAELASAFAAWITRVRLPEIGVGVAPPSDKLEEVLEMLETQPPTWGDRMREEGRVMGREEERKERLQWARKLLLRQARLRYGGREAGALSVLLDSITDTDLLEEIGEWLLICESGEALLARLRQV